MWQPVIYITLDGTFLFYTQSVIFFNHTRCEPLWALQFYWRLVDRQSV